MVNRELFPETHVDPPVPVGKSPGYSPGSMADDRETTFGVEDNPMEEVQDHSQKALLEESGKPGSPTLMRTPVAPYDHLGQR